VVVVFVGVGMVVAVAVDDIVVVVVVVVDNTVVVGHIAVVVVVELAHIVARRSVVVKGQSPPVEVVEPLRHKRCQAQGRHRFPSMHRARG